MYKKLKKLLIIVSIGLVSLASIWLIATNKGTFYVGDRPTVTVSAAKADILQELTNIAGENHVVIAKHIVIAQNDGTGSEAVLFGKIGKGNLPQGLPIEANQSVIENTPNQTSYIIFGNGLSADSLSSQLNSLGNQASSGGLFRFDPSLILLLYMFLLSPYNLGVITLLIAFAALIFSEFVSDIKKAGIYRLSGISKLKISFQGFLENSLFILGVGLIFMILSLSYLFFAQLFVSDAIKAICISLIVWLLLLIFVSLVMTLLYFYVQTFQQINLAIKGKLPLQLLVVIVIFLQIISITASINLSSSLIGINQQLTVLKQGQSVWSKNKNYYTLTTINNFTPNANTAAFLTELFKDPQTLLAINEFNNQIIASQNYGDISVNGYFPNQAATGNILFVNDAFIKQSGINLPSKTQAEINDLTPTQYMLLIPDSQKASASKISSAWASALFPPNAKMKQLSSLYSSNQDIFAYSVIGTLSSSIQSYVKEPLLVVYSASVSATQNPNNILVTIPNQTRALIEKYHLENSIGSLTNAYYSISSRVASTAAERNTLLAANMLGILSSLLLVSLLNTIYLYQNRRKFFIKRLSGLSLWKIHRSYLWVISIAVLLIEGIARYIFQVSTETLLVPIFYLLLVFLLFGYQVKRETNANVHYLKGE